MFSKPKSCILRFNLLIVGIREILLKYFEAAVKDFNSICKVRWWDIESQGLKQEMKGH